jgi:hypothetical protein
VTSSPAEQQCRGLRGRSTNFIHPVLRAAEHFGYWLGTRHAAVTADLVATATTEQFLEEHLPNCSCPVSFPCGHGVARAALRHLLRLLGRYELARKTLPVSPYESLLVEYGRFLRQTCGLAAQTCLYRLRYAREFLHRSFGPLPVWSRATTGGGTRFQAGRAGPRWPSRDRPEAETAASAAHLLSLKMARQSGQVFARRCEILSRQPLTPAAAPFGDLRPGPGVSVGSRG